jgi:collagen type III alpha
MATVQRPSAKPSAIPQYESFVEQQLAVARRRLRGLDLAAWSVTLCSAFLAYGLIMSLADRLWNLATGIRFAAWCCFAVAIATYLGVAVRRLAFRRVNPHFVAHQLEQTVPDAKNSVINWLDLRGESLAPAVRGSLGRRAAQDLSDADPEMAISARPVWWLGAIMGVLLLIQLGWLIAAPGQVQSLLQRAFFPFDKSRIANETVLTLLQPEGGDIAVPANKAVAIRVQADGYVPGLNQKDSLKLHFRYHQNEPFEERGLLPDVDGTWTTVVHADQVRNGFWYKITGGDARLPEDREYRVDVRQIPQVLQFEASFKYRPYLHVKDKSVSYDKGVRPSIKEMRGTEASFTVHTNRILQQCVLELKTGNGRKVLQGEPVAGDPEAWRFNWVLDQSGEFRILFESKDGETNVDRQPCKIEVIPDRAPNVVMTKPAKDLALPANGTLLVEGQATDDFGVKSMQLCIKVIKAPTLAELQPKTFRPDVSFQLVNGKYPLRLDYSDFAALDSLRTKANGPFPLAAGMELEYWLEARDNCDYPDKNGNLGQSTRYKLTIEAPESNKDKVANDRQGAQQQTQQSQQKQDAAMNDQNALANAEKQAEGGGGGQQQQDLENKAKRVQDEIDNANSKGSAKGTEQDKSENPDKGSQEGAGGSGTDKSNPSEKKDNPDKSKDNQGKGNESAQKDQGAGAKSQDPPGTAKEKAPPPSDTQKAGDSTGKDADPKAGGSDAGKGAGNVTPKDGDVGAKGPQGADLKPDPGKEKGPPDKGGQNDAKTQPGGEAQHATPTKKSAPKDAPTTPEQVKGAKGGDPSTQPPPPDAKLGPPESSQLAGNAKAGDRTDATPDDVAKLQDLLKDPAQRDAAKKALERISEEASDARTAQAADKALDDLKGQPAQAKDNSSPAGKSSAQDNNKSPGKSAGADDPGAATSKKGQATADAGTPKKGDNPGKSDAPAKNDPQKPATGNPGTANQGAVGPDDRDKANPIDEEAARRAGELQLESLKKQIDKLRDKLTPEVMKKLNWTEKEREDFLRQMLTAALVRQQKQRMAGEKLAPPGSLQGGLLPGNGPRSLQRDPRNNDGQVMIDRPEAPPEVREALKIFQRK